MKEKIMLLKKIGTELRRWWEIQVTIRELSHLDNKELNDLDIGRWQIPDLARQKARG